jgi:LmbE family N-acetylglucosaminyl deacetylase
VTILVISPHLDDAVLSAGGSIAAWTAAGKRVVVATVYTTGPPLDEVSVAMRKWADYPARRAEDAEAVGAVGADVRWLGQVERAFRKPFLDNLTYFTTPQERSGFTNLAQSRAALESLVELEPERILVPLGIGNHVDHVETMIAATDWALAHGWRDRLWFYEDFYALSTTMRNRHAIARAHGWSRWRAPLLRARRLAVILQAIAVAGRGPDATTFLARELREARWEVTRSPIDENRKLAAIARYPSQAIAFGGMTGIARAMRAYHARWGGCEPLWRASSAR